MVAPAAAALLVAALAAFLLMASSAGAVPTVTTDKAEYHPDETALISGAGYTSGQLLDIVVIRPDLSIVTGAGTNTTGFDTVTADPSGAFTDYPYILNGIFGLYTVNVYSNADTLHATVLATTTFLDDAGPAECNGGPTDSTQPGNQYVIDGSSTPAVPTGEVVTDICIKSGTDTFGIDSHSGLITVDGTYGNDSCFTVSGIGTDTVTITRGATPTCKDISHIDFFTALPTTPTGTFKVTKTFSDGNLAEVSITLDCTLPSTITPPNPATTVGQMVTFTITGFTDPGTTCTATEGAASAGYTKDESGCVDVAISDGGTASCTIVNTLNEATFKVTKTFSDGNPAEVTVELACTSGAIDPPNPATTVGQMHTFTIKGFTDPGTTCSATESGVPPNYVADNSACQDLGISPGVETPCTITNDPATFKVTKTFSDGNLAEVTVLLTCTSGTIAPPNPATTVNQIVIFTITSFTDPGTTCSASESGVPLVYTTDNSACQDLAISDGAQTPCTITNTLNEATFKVTTTFSDGNPAEVSVTLDCIPSATIDPPNPATTVGQMVTFTVSGFTDPGTTCTATAPVVYVAAEPALAGYVVAETALAGYVVAEAPPAVYVKDESDCLNKAVSDGAVVTCTIVYTLGEPPVGGVVEIAVPGTGGDESGTGAALLGLIFVAIVALFWAGSASAWVTRRR